MSAMPVAFALRRCLVGLFALTLTACAATPAVPTPAISPTPTAPPMPALRADYVARGKKLYAQHCSSCHGANLQGQPNWKKPLADGKYPAPPHDDTGHTWHHPDSLLIDIILNGGNGTNGAIPSNMSSFKHVLNNDDAQAILEFIKSRWSAESRAYQWQRTSEVPTP